MNNLTKPHLLGMVAGLFVAGGLVAATMLATSAWVKIKKSQFVSVKGSARKNIKSDLAVWTGSFTAEAQTLLDAQRQLKDDRAKVAVFLRELGMSNQIFGPITIEEVRARFDYETQANGARSSQERTVGYKLKQSVEIRTVDVDRIGELNAASTRLVEQGVLLTTEKAKFIYTKVAEQKIEMLADATKDARLRAESICAQGGARLASLHGADMGVFQITPLNSGETSWEGMNDTTAIEKTITAVVTATFALE